jgi:hypothetical protein
MLEINGIPVTAPSVFQVDVYDIDGDSTARNTLGEMLRDRVTVKRKIICEWPPLTMSEASAILQAVKDVYFEVTYPDPMTGNKAETKTCYVGDRSMPLLLIRNGEYLWQGLKMNFIEK